MSSFSEVWAHCYWLLNTSFTDSVMYYKQNFVEEGINKNSEIQLCERVPQKISEINFVKECVSSVDLMSVDAETLTVAEYSEKAGWATFTLWTLYIVKKANFRKVVEKITSFKLCVCGVQAAVEDTFSEGGGVHQVFWPNELCVQEAVKLKDTFSERVVVHQVFWLSGLCVCVCVCAVCRWL